MIVLDASVAVEWLLQTPTGQQVESRIYSHNETLHVPELLDLEVAQALRRFVRQGKISSARAAEAVDDLADLRVRRYSHVVLLPRIWQLRHNLSAYDASYAVLAEMLGATLLTRDAALASAAGHTATVEVL